MKTRLETNRLLLISIDSTDTEQFFDFLVRNKDYFRKWSALYEENYFAVWYHRAWLESLEQESLNGTQVNSDYTIKPILTELSAQYPYQIL